MVISPTATASDLWTALASLFTDNKDYRANVLEEQFKSLKKGTLSIHDYCQLLKTTADNLADVGHSITDRQLVLQTLHGLPKSYGTVANLISFQNPLPTFLQTRSLLQLEEHRLNEPDTTQTLFHITHQPSRGIRGVNWRGRGRRGRGSTGRGNFNHPQHQGFNTYWNSSSILGPPPPRPPTHPPSQRPPTTNSP